MLGLGNSSASDPQSTDLQIFISFPKWNNFFEANDLNHMMMLKALGANFATWTGSHLLPTGFWKMISHLHNYFNREGWLCQKKLSKDISLDGLDVSISRIIIINTRVWNLIYWLPFLVYIQNTDQVMSRKHWHFWCTINITWPPMLYAALISSCISNLILNNFQM